MSATREASAEQAAFLSELLDKGLLIDSGVPGVYGHNETFERVRTALDSLLSSLAASLGAQRMRFPPLVPRRQLEANGYFSSFPHLAGTVYSFEGGEADAAMQAERAAAHEDYSGYQQMTELALCPAACYPVYPAIAARGELSEEGVFVDAGGSWVFRHEPSKDPARRQIFHQHELVRIGASQTVLSWREQWAQHGLEVLERLGLEPALENASDPFFGRRGKMLAAGQREQALKYELLVRISGPEPTAVASFNLHQDHFAQVYDLRLTGGEVAHTSCAGFGHERIVLALLRAHGMDPSSWPAAVRGKLGL